MTSIRDLDEVVETYFKSHDDFSSSSRLRYLLSRVVQSYFAEV